MLDPNTVDLILAGFESNKPNINSLKLVTPNEHGDYIRSLKNKAIGNAKRELELNEKARAGDVIALTCLGGIYLERRDEGRASQFFNAAIKASNQSKGAIEYAIGTWVKDPDEKIKYFRLAISKGDENAINKLKRCLPKRYGLSLGAFYAILEKPLNKITDTEKRSLHEFANKYPDEFKKVCIQFSIEKVKDVLKKIAIPFSRDTYKFDEHKFDEYKKELVDLIVSDLLEKRENNTSITPSMIEDAAQKYKNKYHSDYFNGMPTLIQEKLDRLEETEIPVAIQNLQRSINIRIRELLYALKPTDKPQPQDAGSSLTDEETKWLNQLLGSEPEKRKPLAEVVTDSPQKNSDSSKVAKINEKNQMLLELAATTMVADALSLPTVSVANTSDMKEEVYSTETNETSVGPGDAPPLPSAPLKDTSYSKTAKFIRAINAINQATEELSKINTEASKKVALSWEEFVIVCITNLIPIIGQCMTYRALSARYTLGTAKAYGDFSEDHGLTERKAVVQKYASEKTIGLFQQRTNAAVAQASELKLPTVQHGKSSRSSK